MALPNIITCEKFNGEIKVKQERGITKNKITSPKWKKRSKHGGGITKNEMFVLFLDEKICFIRLHCNFFGKSLHTHNSSISTWDWLNAITHVLLCSN
jgi:hypothetical protein